MFKNLTIQKKLQLIIILIIISGAFSASIFYYFLNTLNKYSSNQHAYTQLALEFNEIQTLQESLIFSSLYQPLSMFSDSLVKKTEIENKLNRLSEDIETIINLPSVSKSEIDSLQVIEMLLLKHQEIFADLYHLIENRQALIIAITDKLKEEEVVMSSNAMQSLIFYLLSGNSHRLDAVSNFNNITDTLNEKLLIESDNALFLKLSKTHDILGYNTPFGIWYNFYQSSKHIEIASNNLIAFCYNKINKTSGDYSTILFFSMLFLVLLMVFVLQKIVIGILHSLHKLINTIRELSSGKIPEKLTIIQKDEIANLSEKLNIFIEDLKVKSNFASHISENKLDFGYIPLGELDELGHSLITLEEKLKTAAQETQKNRYAEEMRLWTNEGIAKFSEILRLNNDNMNEFTFECLVNLVKYLNASQGAFFIATDNEGKQLELYSSFASDRRKYLKKRLDFGEGLVGTCAIEQETMYLTEIPKGYITISSGLGNVRPTSLLLLPVKSESELLGVIEIASLNKFSQNEIDFANKISESIASTLAGVKMNQQTRFLLDQTNEQAEDMVQKEEEMRQNMEELLATQEESARRESITQSLLKAIDHSVLMVELDSSGIITRANPLFQHAFNQIQRKLKGKYLWAIPELVKDEETLKASFSALSDEKTIEKCTLLLQLNFTYKLLHLNFSKIEQDEYHSEKIVILGYITENIIKES